MTDKKIAIIGGGNMGSAIAEGLLKSGFSRPEDLVVTKRRIETLQYRKDRGVKVQTDNRSAAADADVVIISLKPYNIKPVLKELIPDLNPQKQIVISIV